MRRDEFSKFLVVDGTVHNKSIKSYCSYLNSVEKALNINLDTIKDSRLRALEEEIQGEDFTQAKSTLRKFKAALRKYITFKEYERNSPK